ncbi:MAG: carbohydrate ABC transporter permease [Clostridia bacterium]|nr:carbohydrate ABC transporter permease [Clostridia bacterium]
MNTVKTKKCNNRIKSCFADRVFDIINTIILAFILIITAYPLIITISSSISSANAISAGKVYFLPVDITFDGYIAVVKNKQVITGVTNSVFYTAVGSAINVVMTVLAAYPLSRKDFRPQKFVSLMFAFTMWFSGGMIPSYILVRDLGMINTRWAMLIPPAFGVWNMVLVRTYFQSNIPESLFESARLDGCDDWKYLMKIVLPLSKPILAVITLYSVVGHWNAFFSANLYLQSAKLQPLPVILREILLLSQTNDIANEVAMATEGTASLQELNVILKYSLVVVSSLPMALLYVFTQKYFTKGIMVGSVKG